MNDERQKLPLVLNSSLLFRPFVLVIFKFSPPLRESLFLSLLAIQTFRQFPPHSLTELLIIIHCLILKNRGLAHLRNASPPQPLVLLLAAPPAAQHCR